MPAETPFREIPRWIKVLGIIVVVLILALFIFHFAKSDLRRLGAATSLQMHLALLPTGRLDLYGYMANVVLA